MEILSKLLNSIIDNSLSTTDSLKQLALLSSILDLEEIYTWALLELNGYEDEDSVPEYRIFDVLPKFSGYRQGQFYKRQNFPIEKISKENEDLKYKLTHHPMVESIGVIIKSLQDGQTYQFPLTELKKYFQLIGIEATEFYLEIPTLAFDRMLERLKTKIIKTAIKLEQEYGNLDNILNPTSESGTETDMKVDTKKEILQEKPAQIETSSNGATHIGDQYNIQLTSGGDMKRFNIGSTDASEEKLKWFWIILIPIVIGIVLLIIEYNVFQ